MKRTTYAAPKLAIVVPCYNEEEVFSYSLEHLRGKLSALIASEKVQADSYLLFVDDGSQDATWSLIEAAHESNSPVAGLKLSRNQGHQKALWAGLSSAECDASISIDADLQDDINAIDTMVNAYLEGKDVVLGVRDKRNTDTFFKRTTANVFYDFMHWMGVEQVENHADFRLLSRRAMDALLAYNEDSNYIRGLIPFIGFPTEQVFYDRKARTAGESKYPFRKMLALALNGITSLSVFPLRLITAVGFGVALFAVALAIWVILSYLGGGTLRGWASVLIAVIFFGGVNMLSIGVIGEYIGKIHKEVKKQPKYFVDKILKPRS